MWVAWDFVGEFTHEPSFRGWTLIGAVAVFAILAPLAVFAFDRALLWAIGGFRAG
jgi:hypothetical protein